MPLINYILIFLLLLFGLIERAAAFRGTGNENRGNFLPDEFHAGHTFLNAGIPWHQGFSAGSDSISSRETAVVINELMVDPSPVVGLPDREYIELYNPGTGPVNLKGWLLGFGSKQKALPDVTISPGGFLLLTATGGSKDLQSFGKVTEVSGLSLANAGVMVTLSDTRKVVRDQVEYLPAMLRVQCRDGGYSLERVDPERMCGQFYNWETTLSSNGGTPGTVNSVWAINRDVSPPDILSTVFVNGSVLEVLFSERFQFRGDPVGGLLNLTLNAEVDSMVQDQNSCTLKICFRPSSITDGTNYSLILHGLEDACGNVMADKTVKFGYYNPVKSDILINEVLFNPYPEGSDFVEIYNNSLHDVDLSGLFLATRGDDKALRQITRLSSSQQYLAPGSYLAITKSIEGLGRYYSLKCPGCLVQVSRFPSLADESGCVVLLGLNQDVIDEMEYNDKMHHPFITEKEGIALERIRFLVASGRSENWQSAAKHAGFATPGYRNSTQDVPDTPGRDITLESTIFSPNGDGINDLLVVRLNGIEPGELVNMAVFDALGREVRSLANNLTAGKGDQITWDGSDSRCSKVQPGIYILKVSLFHPHGNQRTRKFACVLTDRL